MRLVAVLLLVSWRLAAQDFSGVDKAPAKDQAAMDAANAALAANDWAKAAKLLTGLAEAHPKDSHVLFDLGSAQDALDQTGGAETSYRAAIEVDGGYLEPRLALGLLLARNGRMDEARAELAAAASIDKGDKQLRARALRAMARIDAKARPGDARQELLAALALSPETPADTLLTAELAEKAGSDGKEAAEAAYRQVLQMQPHEPEATAALGHLLAGGKRYSEAEKMLTEGLAAHPGDPAISIELGQVYSADGKPELAVPLLEALHTASPGEAHVTRLLGELYVATKQYAKAEPLLAGLMAQTPRDGELVDLRAVALLHLHETGEAERILRPVVADPGMFPSTESWGIAITDMAFAASDRNEPEVVLQLLQNRAKVLPTSPPILFLTAISEDRLHHVRNAVEAYKKFLAASNGAYPNEEFQSRHRLVALATMK